MQQRIKAVGVIPARYDSVRFPGKPLADIGGKPMIQHVYERVVRAASLEAVFVATDDDRIAQAVVEFGGKWMMTRRDHATGSDRVAEVAEKLAADFIVNIQGDEPFISSAAIDVAVDKLSARDDADVATLVCEVSDPQVLLSNTTAKVVLSENDVALYFSRAPIPYNRDERDPQRWLAGQRYYQHIGLYVFRRDFLMKFVGWPQGNLEKIEKLEQLRILEKGYQIVCAHTEYHSFCVDTPQDLEVARAIWKEKRIADGR